MSLRYQDLARLVWQNAEILRSRYNAEDYGRAIIPLFILRRIELTIADTRKQVADACKEASDAGKPLKDLQVEGIAGRPIWNRTSITLRKVTRSENPKRDMIEYIGGADPKTRLIWDQMGFISEIERLDRYDLLRRMAGVFGEYELQDQTGSDELNEGQAIGTVYEDLLNLSDSGFTEGAHFTPREIVKLTVDLAIAGDTTIGRRGSIRTIYDGTCGSAGMLVFAQKGILRINPHAEVEMYGQDSKESAIAMSNAELAMFGMHGEIKLGDTLTEDQFKGLKANFVVMNPPFGIKWEESRKAVEAEHEAGNGRFDHGLPRITDGSLLFLMHGVSKLQEPREATKEHPERRAGGRMGIIMSGSPLFSGGAGSGESDIRRWLIEEDLLECIIMLPGNMFSNTGIQTYLWILTNDKARLRKGKVQVIDATQVGRKLRRNQKSRNWEMTTPETPGPDGLPLGDASDTAGIRRLWEAFEQADSRISRVVNGTDFGYRRITVEQPLRLKIKEGNLKVTLAEAKLDERIAEVVGQMVEQAREEGAPPSTVMQEIAGELKASGIKAKELDRIRAAILERDEAGEIQLDRHGKPVPDPELRDTEDVPLSDSVDAYMAREVVPHTPDAWVSEDPKHGDEYPEGYAGERRGKVGYEFKLGQLFPKARGGRALAQVEQELRNALRDMQAALQPILAELGMDGSA